LLFTETKARILGTVFLGATGLSLDAGRIESAGAFLGSGIGSAVFFWFIGVIVAFASRSRKKVDADGPPQPSLMWSSWKYALLFSAAFAGISALNWLVGYLQSDTF
jgi:O-antigen/teichoic acid export membrane protein